MLFRCSKWHWEAQDPYLLIYVFFKLQWEMGHSFREGAENDKWHCILAWILSLQIQKFVYAKNIGMIENCQATDIWHICHTCTHACTHRACFQIHLKGSLALSAHYIQFYLTQQSLQTGHWYLSIAILFLGFVWKRLGFHGSLEVLHFSPFCVMEV